MSVARGGEIRTRFGRPRGYVWLGLLVSTIGAGALALIAVTLPWATGEVGRWAEIAGVWAVGSALLVAAIRVVPRYQFAAGVGLLVWTVLMGFAEPSLFGVAIAVGLLAVGGAVVWAWAPVYRLEVDPRGVHVRWHGQEASFAWADIDSWWVGLPQPPLTQGRNTIQGPVVMLTPAAGVDDPAAGPWRARWVPDPGRWVMTARTDGAPGEIVAALERFAPDKAGREPGHRTR